MSFFKYIVFLFLTFNICAANAAEVIFAPDEGDEFADGVIGITTYNHVVYSYDKLILSLDPFSLLTINKSKYILRDAAIILII